MAPVGPRRSGGVTVQHRAGGSAEVVAADGSVLGVVNVTAAAALELCDGRTSVEEMAHAVSTVFAVDPDRAGSELAEALAALRAIGALDGDA